MAYSALDQLCRRRLASGARGEAGLAIQVPGAIQAGGFSQPPARAFEGVSGWGATGRSNVAVCLLLGVYVRSGRCVRAQVS